MSTSYARITFRNASDAVFDPTSVVLSDPTGTYGIKRNDNDAAVVADGTALTKISKGIYEKSFTDPAADLTYTAYFEYVIGGETYWTPKIMTGGVTAGGTLLLTFAELYSEVGQELYNTTAPTGADLTECKLITNLAYRTALAAHPWTFLTPAATIALWATVTGTVSGSPSHAGGISTVTATAASFYASMVGGTFTFDTSETEYTVLGYTSTTVITVSGDASAETADDTFTITADGNYALPSTYASVKGGFNYAPESGLRPLQERTPDFIRSKRALAAVTSDPRYYAEEVRSFTAADGVRSRLLVWPTPATTKTLHYAFRVIGSEMSNDSDYPIGPMEFGLLVKATALAEAEARGPHKAKGIRADDRKTALANAITADNRNRPSNLGYNANGPGGGRYGTDRMDHEAGLAIS